MTTQDRRDEIEIRIAISALRDYSKTFTDEEIHKRGPEAERYRGEPIWGPRPIDRMQPPHARSARRCANQGRLLDMLWVHRVLSKHAKSEPLMSQVSSVEYWIRDHFRLGSKAFPNDSIEAANWMREGKL